MLRLPKDMPKVQKLRIVEDVIQLLGLESIRKQLVGTVESRGISGGQRKRTNIGMELVSDPSILFMDEPVRKQFICTIAYTWSFIFIFFFLFVCIL
jgi:ABC-type multidrug transport system ATPase subunit